MEDAINTLFTSSQPLARDTLTRLKNALEQCALDSESGRLSSYISEASRRLLSHNPFFIITHKQGHFWDTLLFHIQQSASIFKTPTGKGHFEFNIREQKYHITYDAALIALFNTLLDENFHDLVLSPSDLPSPIFVAFAQRDVLRRFLTQVVLAKSMDPVDWIQVHSENSFPLSVYDQLINSGLLYDCFTSPRPELSASLLEPVGESDAFAPQPFVLSWNQFEWSELTQILEQAELVDHLARLKTYSPAKPEQFLSMLGIYMMINHRLKSELSSTQTQITDENLINRLFSMEVAFPLVRAFLERNLDVRTLMRPVCLTLFSNPQCLAYLNLIESISKEITEHMIGRQKSLQLSLLFEKYAKLVGSVLSSVYSVLGLGYAAEPAIEEINNRRTQETEFLNVAVLGQLGSALSTTRLVQMSTSHRVDQTWTRFRTTQMPAIMLLNAMDIYWQPTSWSQSLRMFLRPRHRFTFSAIGMPLKITYSEISRTMQLLKEKYYKLWPKLFDESLVVCLLSRPFLVVQPQILTGLRLLLLLEQHMDSNLSPFQTASQGPLADILFREFMGMHSVEAELLSEIAIYCTAKFLAWNLGGKELSDSVADPQSAPGSFERYRYLPKFMTIINYPSTESSRKQLMLFLDSKNNRSLQQTSAELLLSCSELEEEYKIQTINQDRFSLEGGSVQINLLDFIRGKVRARNRSERASKIAGRLSDDTVEQEKSFNQDDDPFLCLSPPDGSTERKRLQKRIHFDTRKSLHARLIEQLYLVILVNFTDVQAKKISADIFSGLLYTAHALHRRANQIPNLASTTQIPPSLNRNDPVYQSLAQDFWSESTFLSLMQTVKSSLTKTDFLSVAQPSEQADDVQFMPTFYSLLRYASAVSVCPHLKSKEYAETFMSALRHVEWSYVEGKLIQKSERRCYLQTVEDVNFGDNYIGRLRPVLFSASGNETKPEDQFQSAVFENFFSVLSERNLPFVEQRNNSVKTCEILVPEMDLLTDICLQYSEPIQLHPDSVSYCTKPESAKLSYLSYVQEIQGRILKAQSEQ